jgi:hypothetical protein
VENVRLKEQVRLRGVSGLKCCAVVVLLLQGLASEILQHFGLGCVSECQWSVDKTHLSGRQCAVHLMSTPGSFVYSTVTCIFMLSAICVTPPLQCHHLLSGQTLYLLLAAAGGDLRV